jgi:hypothetical protein
LRGRKARPCALADDFALELGERPDEMHLQPASGRGRVDRLGQRSEARAAGVEVFHQFDQMFQPAAEPVQAPDDKRVVGAQMLKAAA